MIKLLPIFIKTQDKIIDSYCLIIIKYKLNIPDIIKHNISKYLSKTVIVNILKSFLK